MSGMYVGGFPQPSTHLDSPNSYVRMLFIDFRSACNTVIPWLSQPYISTSLCNWTWDFQTRGPFIVQATKVLLDKR